MFPDSKIAAQMALGRRKCATLVQNLGNHVLQELVNKLRQHKFSIILDETTDCTTNKALALVVKFFDHEQNRMKTAMLDIINVFDGNEAGSSGEGLYNLLIKCLENYKIPLTNLIGLAADGAANIMGKINSLTSRLRKDLPDIVIFKCVSHSIHLCSSAAAKTLPQNCEDLIHNVYNFFSHSAKRKFEFKEYQIFCELKPHKMLHPSATRWLSLEKAVDRIKQHWGPLQLYFDKIWYEEKLSSVQEIHQSLHDKYVFAFLTFLQYILPKLNSINIVFQCQGPSIHLLNLKIFEVYKTILNSFCHSEVIAKVVNLNDIDPSNTSNHKPLNQIYLGMPMVDLLNKPQYQDGNTISIIRDRCRIFLIEVSMQIKKRFDLSSNLWKCVSYLHPKNILDNNLRRTVPSLNELVNELPAVSCSYDTQKIDDQWRDIPWHTFPENIKELQKNAEVFYQHIISIEDDFGENKYECIGKFALEVLSLPCSNADAERLFSQYNLIKRKSRNCLKLESIRALIHLKDSYKLQDNFQPTKEMLMSVTN